MSVKETHLKGTPQSVIKYVSEEEAHNVRSGEDDTTGYYAENSNVQSVWMGKGAAAQGLSGRVNNEDFNQLLCGVTMYGQDISKRGNHQNARRIGSDWTFSAPKAASILAIEDSRIKTWMLESVQETIEEFYAKEMAYARKGKGGAITEFSENIAAAGFLHEIARATDGIIDPQLHVHVVVPNIVQRADGEWVSLRSDYGENNAKVYAMGDAQVAKFMKKMLEQGGYYLETRLECDKNDIEHLSFGVQGISREAEDAFSARKKQIHAYLLKNGIDPKKATRKQKDAAVLNTRAGKDKNIDNVSLKRAQRLRAHDAGIDFGSIRDDATKRAAEFQRSKMQENVTGEDAVNVAVQHLSEHSDVFSRTAILTEAIKAGAGSVDIVDIRNAIEKRSGGLVAVGEMDRGGTGKKEAQFTTKTAMLREAEFLRRAESGQGQVDVLIQDQPDIEPTPDLLFIIKENKMKNPEPVMARKDNRKCIQRY